MVARGRVKAEEQVTAKCSQCGFLALRNIVDGRLVEADNEYRKYGKPILEGNECLSLENYPLCFIRAFDLEKEGEDAANQQIRLHMAGQPTPDWEAYIIQIINKDRSCGSLVDYQQGYTPRERMDMLLDDKRRQLEHRWKMRMAIFSPLLAAVLAVIVFLVERAID